MNVVIIRAAVYDFLSRLKQPHAVLESAFSTVRQVGNEDIASSLGERLTPEDFAEFIRIKSEISWIVSGLSKPRQGFYIGGS